MRSLTKDQAFDNRVLDFLSGLEPQTVCGVAIGISEPAEGVRASLHRLSEQGHVTKYVRPNRAELFERFKPSDSQGGDAA